MLLCERKESGNQATSTKTYIYEPDSFRPIALIQDQQIYHYHLDHLGTPQELTQHNGDLAWSVHYRAYGNVVKKVVESVENNLRFQGQYYDKETGLHYNRHRYYDPQTARFINQDPIGLVGGNNNYQYVPNPVAWVDPFGLACKEDDLADVANSIAKLSDDLAGTFAGGRYSSRVLEKDMILYRAGTADRPLGQFFAKDMPISKIQTRIDKAVLPVWPGGATSPIDTVFKVKIPAGTTIHTSQVGSQGGYFVGGTQQIVVEKPWLIEGVNVLGSSPLK